MRYIYGCAAWVIAIGMIFSCADGQKTAEISDQRSYIEQPETTKRPPANANTPPATIIEKVRVVATYPHDKQAFTQGLYFDGQFLYESTGLNGRSTLRKVDLFTGNILASVKVPAVYFAEGMTKRDSVIYQLTWRAGLAFVYDAESFEKIGEFRYNGEGWGLTDDGVALIMSDGTSRLRFLDPATFEVRKVLEVRDGRRSVGFLNELEYVRGEIYANVWRTEKIARIDPGSGQVLGWLDCSGLLTPDDYYKQAPDVLNGIAYDAKHDRLFITGKLWPKLFEIRRPERR